MPVTADFLIKNLKLTPNPEGGYFRETYREPITDGSGRAAVSIIYYLLTPESPVGRLHRQKMDIKTYLDRVRNKEELLWGFGHRVYKFFDPRAEILKAAAAEVLPPDELLKRAGDDMSTLLNIAGLCNVAKVFFKEGEGWSARGDPTECAIQTFAHRFDWGRERWTEGDSPEWSESHSFSFNQGLQLTFYHSAAQVAEYPFDSDLKRMSVLYERNGYVAFNHRATGAPADALPRGTANNSSS